MINEYLKTYNKKDCNGCTLCTIGCPTSAIKMVEDSEGFFYPEIDEKKCIKCNKCKNICSNFNDSKGTEKVYMAINKNKKELKNSASGGMFYILAKYVIEKNGVVFGVEYDENLKVRHNHYETIEECKKFQGSKYLRSDIGNSYREVENFLKQDKFVLFTGTPCQCNALKTYLKKDYEKLVICDVVCHANPSQKVFDKYVKELEEKNSKKVKTVWFRSKENGWRNQTPIIEYEDGEKEEENTYFTAFGKELLGRPSCHDCKFAISNRVTDFSMADFWGIDKVLPKVKNDDTGISLFTVNNNKAQKIFKEINNNMTFEEVDKELAFKYNHGQNVPPHKNRQKFFDNLDNKPVIENMKECLKVSLVRRILRKCKRVAKKVLGK